MSAVATRLQEVCVREVDIALTEPFGIAGGAQAVARNALVQVRLVGGAVGWGEAAPFPAFNGETRESAVAAMRSAIPPMIGADARAWRSLPARLAPAIGTQASAARALEMAALDALCRHHGVPMWAWLGGAQRELRTDMTITTGSAALARTAAARIAAGGYRTIKVKVGGAPIAEDVDRLLAAMAAAPSCDFILDANGAMDSAEDAVGLVHAARAAGGRVTLFEQPLPRDDLRGLAEVGARAHVPVCADESAGSLEDILLLARTGAAQAVNLKIMKSGIAQALDMAAAARACGLELMIGGMVETRLAMTVSACLAAGLGGFSFVDLDTPQWMVDSPVAGGFVHEGDRLRLDTIAAGHGVTPRDA
jgi:L-alanine-DL-glutamate epimerase-like enolase superfamily enzyme